MTHSKKSHPTVTYQAHSPVPKAQNQGSLSAYVREMASKLTPQPMEDKKPVLTIEQSQFLSELLLLLATAPKAKDFDGIDREASASEISRRFFG